MGRHLRVRGVTLALLVAGTSLLTTAPPVARAAVPSSAFVVGACSDPDSFGGALDVGDNHLAIAKDHPKSPAYRLHASWDRWDGQGVAQAATLDLGRPIDWNGARMVVRIREDTWLGTQIMLREEVLTAARFAPLDANGETWAAGDVEPDLLRPQSGGTVHVKIRVERPGLDLATCWADVPPTPMLGGSTEAL